MYYINGKVSKNQFTFKFCICINYFSKTSFYFKMGAVNVKLCHYRFKFCSVLVWWDGTV